MKLLPSDAVAYKRTPLFTQDSIPQGLLGNHTTKEGTWGLIQVTDGQLEYVIGVDEKRILTPGHPGVIEPQVIHHVKPLDHAAFFIEFYRQP